MKYKTIIETDDFEDFEFFEDGNGKYIHGIDAGSVNGEWIALYFIECEQEPTGHWIDREVYDADRWECSECGRTEQYKENYCPDCGAIMVEPQESEGKE